MDYPDYIILCINLDYVLSLPDLHGVNDTERVAGDPVVIRQRKMLLRVQLFLVCYH